MGVSVLVCACVCVYKINVCTTTFVNMSCKRGAVWMGEKRSQIL